MTTVGRSSQVVPAGGTRRPVAINPDLDTWKVRGPGFMRVVVNTAISFSCFAVPAPRE